MNERHSRLESFAQWASRSSAGGEVDESRVFLERLFRALGHESVAAFEYLDRRRDGEGLEALVWRPVVVVEMKRRGVKLGRHARQAYEDWANVAPGRPRYAVLCNFDELWVYDFCTQMDGPVHVLAVAEIREHAAALAFMRLAPEAPVFARDHEAVTRRTADRLAQVYNSLAGRGVDRAAAQRFTLQTILALFTRGSERSPREAVEWTAELEAVGRRFSGGLFAGRAAVELNAHEFGSLREAAGYDWSQVRPEIFGTLFEHSLGEAERHAYGAHFTRADDIMKIVRPTIVEPWVERVDGAKTLKKLQGLAYQLQTFRVLDPACGSGNFLYIAYREVKRIEASIYAKIAAQSARVSEDQRVLGFVTSANFYGIDIDPFAVELAKVTMMIARKLAISELHITEPALPLHNLDANFVVGDALIGDDGRARAWPACDVIVGNPPFLGAKRLKPERGDEYVRRVRKLYKDVPGMADYCVYWFRKAHDHLPECTAANPLVGRAGLVGTQNVRNNKSREGGLDHVVKTGTIVEAVDNQPWSGDAAVHVSIVNWVKSQASFIKKTRRIWTPIPPGTPQVPPRSETDGQDYDLTVREAAFISSSLSDSLDISSAATIECNKRPQRTFQGVTPGYDGFVVTAARRDAWVARRATLAKYLPGYLIGRELMSGDGRPQRHLIDFNELDLAGASGVAELYGEIRASVLPEVQATLAREVAKGSDMVEPRREHLQRWWTFWARRAELRAWMKGHERIVAASRTQRFPFVFEFISTRGLLPGDKLQLFAFDDDYSFGVLQSSAHTEWFAKKTSRLKNEEDFNYSSKSVFNSFPWPTAATVAGVRAVAAAAVALRELRRGLMADGRGLRDLYATLQVPGKSALRDAHARLDEAVRAVYGFSRRASILQDLFDLNVAIVSGEVVASAPGVPAGVVGEGLVTGDCIAP